ncbi:MAG: hypothetical protein IJH64_00760 [Oscillospiraceae bacterium]|nr:hypothetical protein [Oscillospiraceae bacterium]
MTRSQYEQFLRAEQAYLREPDEPEDEYERDEDFERDEREEYKQWVNA